MPIYEYKCLQCGVQIEKRQSVSDAPLTTCEKCHGVLEKQWSLSGFQFKGEGWYVTDYANPKSPAKPDEKSSAAESTTSPETASNKGASDKTESATTAKPAKE